MKAWLKDFVSALHWGVPDRVPDWDHLQATEDRMNRAEQDVESLKAIVIASASIKWGRRKEDRVNQLH